ncbi:unnamed protein product [Durusdinium trenchii]|uniref:Secreted protein n=1 Tax=Durusdinium trenchii TaxID=1381693 RepID=A0ABP0NLV4_9DINO
MALWLCLPWLASWSLVLGRRATTRSQETLVTHWASASTTRNGGSERSITAALRCLRLSASLRLSCTLARMPLSSLGCRKA